MKKSRWVYPRRAIPRHFKRARCFSRIFCENSGKFWKIPETAERVSRAKNHVLEVYPPGFLIQCSVYMCGTALTQKYFIKIAILLVCHPRIKFQIFFWKIPENSGKLWKFWIFAEFSGKCMGESCSQDNVVGGVSLYFRVRN